VTDYMDGMAEGYADGRAEALEEAAVAAEREGYGSASDKIAAAIRALKDKPDPATEYLDQHEDEIRDRLRKILDDMDKPANQTDGGE
jgi:Arc/MetJ-type ribon-helix-helix transcriptional regulator